MVNVRQHEATSPVIDEEAERQFAQHWGVYRKLVVNDYVFHREAYATLHRILVDEVRGPFRFLDLACGDAQGVVGALRGTAIRHYHGVDLSAPALAMAKVAVEVLDCPVELDRRDFVAAMADRPEPADVVWIGLSLHHLQPPDKLAIMREARAVGGGAGRLVIYEPTRREGEDRAAYLARFEATNRPLWGALTDGEWHSILDHVTRCDFPETPADWAALGRQAGFAEVAQPFVAPTDLYRVFAYSG